MFSDACVYINGFGTLDVIISCLAKSSTARVIIMLSIPTVGWYIFSLDTQSRVALPLYYNLLFTDQLLFLVRSFSHSWTCTLSWRVSSATIIALKQSHLYMCFNPTLQAWGPSIPKPLRTFPSKVFCAKHSVCILVTICGTIYVSLSIYCKYFSLSFFTKLGQYCT